MFRNKSDVDKRVSALLYNAKNEHERNLRCYNIALLYYKAHDFESAQKYATMYLSVRDDSAAAHKLLGQAYEKLGQKDKAIASYTKSLKLESDQSDLILKICELLCEKDVEFDPQLARYWSDRASLMFPHAPPVFMLKEKLMMSDSSLASQDLEELLHAELKTKPADMNIRIKLLKLYAESGRAEVAVNHAFDVEVRQTYSNSLVWYQCIDNICKIYIKDRNAECDWEFYLQWISVLDRMCSLCISETSSVYDISEVTKSIYNLDQRVYQANRVAKGPDMFKEFLKYISAQLSFYMGVALLKKAKKENVTWKETKKLVSPLFFLAQLPSPSEVSWALPQKELYRKLINFWVDQAHSRILQAGYILICLSKENHSEKMFIDKVNHFISSDWRQQIFEKTFHSLDQINISTSYFASRVEFPKGLLKVPSSNSLKSSSYLSSFENANFGSLHHLVWLGLQQLKKISILEIKLPSFRTTCFKSLQFTINNLNNIGVETINQLDIDTFLYASVFCAAAVLENHKTNGYVIEDRLQVLPADISPQLCSSDQSKWWSNVCSLMKVRLASQIDSSESISDLRFNLQRGLEVTRGEGLPPLLMIAIARTFASRALISDVPEEYDGCHARALHFWKLVHPILERFISNKTLISSSQINNLFDFPVKDLNLQDAKALLEEAKFFIGCHYMSINQYEKAIEEFKNLKSPLAVYNLAMVYQKWAEVQVDGVRGEEITSEIRCRHVVLASKAREYLMKVKALIKNDTKHPLYSSVEKKLFDIDDMLARIEPENERDANGTLDGSASGESGNTPGFADLNMIISSSHRNRVHRTSTPRRIQVSHEQKTNNFNMSELIDLLSVQHSTNQLKMQQVLEQVRLIVDKVDMATSEQRSLIDGLTTRLNNFESEMRNNISELRKEMKRPDLCNMFEEDDYTDEMLQYQNYSQYYPHSQRAVQNSAAAIPYGNQYFSPRLDPLYQGNLSFYNQGALPFSEGQQLPDFLRAIPSGSQKPVQPLLHPSQSGVQGPLSHVTNVPNTSKIPVHTNIIPNNMMMSAEALPPATVLPHPPLSVSIPPPNNRTSTNSSAPHNFQIPLPPMPKPVLNIEERVEEETPPPAYDPLPDFKPLVPLPKEIEVCTGEEGEEILFERKAKLYRFINSEWKERGIGNLKILKHTVTGKFRIIMRREQVHKICANHFITADLNLEPKANADKAWIWVANDFADEEMRVEKFCAKFKSPEDSSEFKNIFDNAKKELHDLKSIPVTESNSEIDSSPKITGFFTSPSSNIVSTSSTEANSGIANTLFKFSNVTLTTPHNLNVSTTPTQIATSSDTPKQDVATQQTKTNVGGFTFCLSKPKLKIPEEPKETKVETPKEINPFSKLNNFVSPSSTSQTANSFTSVFGGTSFASGNDKSKSVLELKKTFGDTKPDLFNKQSEFVSTGKTKIDQSNDNVEKNKFTEKSNEPTKNSESTQKEPLSCIFKSLPGSWECKSCYLSNKSDIQQCVACNEKRPGSLGDSKTEFNKLNASKVSTNEVTSSIREMKTEKPSLSGVFKPSPGSWECNACLVRNTPDKKSCAACGEIKPGNIIETSAKTNSVPQFQFGMPSHSETDSPKYIFGSSNTTTFSFPSSTFSFNAGGAVSSNDSSVSAFSQKPTEFSFTSTQNLKSGPNSSIRTPTFQFTMPVPKVTSPTVLNKSQDDSHDSEPDEEEGDHIQFQPVIPLPEKITVVTGEENETVLYCQRAKLFRFDSTSKEWKERGVGDVKILKHNVSGKIRFLMRRDQVMKICLNHLITEEIILRPKDEKTWLWYAVDYSEGIEAKEQFAIRFKSSDIANEFKDAFDKAPQMNDLSLDTSAEGTTIQKQEEVSSTTSNGMVHDTKASNSDSDLEITYEQKAPPELVQKALALKLPANYYCYLEKPPCPGCCGCEEDEDEIEEINTEKTQQLDFSTFKKPTVVSQQLIKEAEQTSQKPEETKPTIFGYNPNITSAAGFSFASALQNTDTESKTSTTGSHFFKNESSFSNPTSQSSSIFGKAFQSGTEVLSSGVVLDEKKEKFQFGSVSDAPLFTAVPPSFGSLANASTLASFADKKDFGNKNFTWAGAGTKLFGDVKEKASITSVKNDEQDEGNDEDNDEYKEDEDHDPQYDPIVPLPDKIEVKTGEEDEEIVFIERGQLYRYDTVAKEWKQRGIGDMKILKNKYKNVYRLVMRREQVHKLVCNHLISSDFMLKNKSDTAFCWSALNFCPEQAGDQPVSENLCIKFKQEGTANKFKSAIKSCIESMKEEDNRNSGSTT